MSNKLIILNSATDAASHYPRPPSEDLVCCTHGEVNDYYQAHGADCLHLASLLEDDAIAKCYRQAHEMAGSVLAGLDRELSPEISSLLGLPAMDYFQVLYTYLLGHECFGYLKLDQALRQLIASRGVTSIEYHDSALLGRLPGFGGFDLVRGIADELGAKLERMGEFAPPGPPPLPIPPGLSPRALAGRWRRRLGRALRSRPLDARSKVILLGPPYDLDFLPGQLGEARLITWPLNGLPALADVEVRLTAGQRRGLDRLAQRIDAQGSQAAGVVFERFLRSGLSRHFGTVAAAHLEPLLVMHALHRREKVDLCIWGNPPIQGSAALVAEFLLRAGVAVVGAQHGGSYAVQDLGWSHFESDFKRCTHFLSYGFDHKDLERTYPGTKVPCRIIPVGSHKEALMSAQPATKPEPIDVLYAPTLGLSLVKNNRMNSYRLARAQAELVDSLAGWPELKIWVKPPPGFARVDCTIREKLKRSGLMVSDEPLVKFLKRYSPKLMLIDYPSTPLWETVGRDMDILLLEDALYPFEEQALALLRRRVQVFAEVGEMKAALTRFLQTGEPRLRDDAFYRRFVHRPAPATDILELVRGLLARGPGQPLVGA